MSDHSRISEARGLVQRLCTILRREDEQTGHASSSAAIGTGSSEESRMSTPGVAGVTSHMSRCDAGFTLERAPSAIPNTSNPRETHQMLFGYQPSASAGVKRSRSVSSFSRGRSASYAKKPKKLTPWSHCFVWLSDTDADTVPGDYSLLAANGLGKKKLQLCEQSNASDIHDAILEAFPKLSSAGGYDLFRTVENSKRLTHTHTHTDIQIGEGVLLGLEFDGVSPTVSTCM